MKWRRLRFDVEYKSGAALEAREPGHPNRSAASVHGQSDDDPWVAEAFNKIERTSYS
jgi:hypothetical protein